MLLFNALTMHAEMIGKLTRLKPSRLHPRARPEHLTHNAHHIHDVTIAVAHYIEALME